MYFLLFSSTYKQFFTKLIIIISIIAENSRDTNSQINPVKLVAIKLIAVNDFLL